MRGPRERIPLGTASGECTGAVGLVESRACDSAVWTRRPSVQTAVGWTVAQCAHYGNCACTCVCVHISGAVLSGARTRRAASSPCMCMCMHTRVCTQAQTLVASRCHWDKEPGPRVLMPVSCTAHAGPAPSPTDGGVRHRHPSWARRLGGRAPRPQVSPVSRRATGVQLHAVAAWSPPCTRVWERTVLIKCRVISCPAPLPEQPSRPQCPVMSASSPCCLLPPAPLLLPEPRPGLPAPFCHTPSW